MCQISVPGISRQTKKVINSFPLFMIRYLLLFTLYLANVLYAEDAISLQQILKGAQVTSIDGDEEEIWAASNGNGIYRINRKDGKVKNFSSAGGEVSLDFFYCIAVSPENIFAGSIDGLFIYDRKSGNWTKRKFGKGGQLSNWIRSVRYDAKSNVVWIGRFMYLTKYDVKRRRFIDYDMTVRDNIKTNTIKVVSVDGDSLVWFGTEAGLHKYDKSRDLKDEESLYFFDNRLNYFRGEGKEVSISAIFFEQSNIWIGLDELLTAENPEYNIGGLYKYDRKNEWIRFDKNDGLSANGIYAIERTGNKLWVSLYQFSTRDKEIYGRGLVLIDILSEEVTTLYHPELASTIYAMYFDGNSMWLGSSTGLSKIEIRNKFADWK
ncbi:MAG: hypothetical protein K9G57_05025 [Ignavibacteriales bacterium]|nr:hypothetical protein [Ignavibacteriales bacterium]MCF8436187.1 hypothetical protein [Ignavibacteriales bacterium]